MVSGGRAHVVRQLHSEWMEMRSVGVFAAFFLPVLTLILYTYWRANRRK